jgi:hypothetical protein
VVTVVVTTVVLVAGANESWPIVAYGSSSECGVGRPPGPSAVADAMWWVSKGAGVVGSSMLFFAGEESGTEVICGFTLPSSQTCSRGVGVGGVGTGRELGVKQHAGSQVRLQQSCMSSARDGNAWGASGGSFGPVGLVPQARVRERWCSAERGLEAGQNTQEAPKLASKRMRRSWYGDVRSGQQFGGEVTEDSCRWSARQTPLQAPPVQPSLIPTHDPPAGSRPH